MRADCDNCRPERSGVDTNDPELIQKYLHATYAADFSIEQTGDLHVRHSRIDAGGFALEEISHTGRVRLRAAHLPSLVAVRVLEGRVRSDYGELAGSAGPGQWLLAATGIDGVRIRLDNARLRTVVLDRPLLTEAAAADTDEATAPVVRFTGPVPVSAAMSGSLDATERFVRHLLCTPETASVPALVSAAGRMVATAILATFPYELPVESVEGEHGEEQPAVLRQSVEFIHANAAGDIGVADIAAAVFVTPRTIQYMFRRHLDTTPSAYLRTVRLARAHEELVAGDKTLTTVAGTAARWGFAHTGRFAVLYRETYGESPHETLRRG